MTNIGEENRSNQCYLINKTKTNKSRKKKEKSNNKKANKTNKQTKNNRTKRFSHKQSGGLGGTE